MTALRTPLYLFFAIVFCNILNIEAQNTNVEVNNYAENITKKLTKDLGLWESQIPLVKMAFVTRQTAYEEARNSVQGLNSDVKLKIDKRFNYQIRKVLTRGQYNTFNSLKEEL